MMKIKLINKKLFLVLILLVFAFISGIVLDETYWRYTCRENYIISLDQMKYISEGTNGIPLLSRNEKYVALDVREGSTSSIAWIYIRIMRDGYRGMPYDIEHIVWKWYKENHKVPYKGKLPDHAYVHCEKWLDNYQLVIGLDGHDSSTKYEVEKCRVVFDISTGECYEYDLESSQGTDS